MTRFLCLLTFAILALSGDCQAKRTPAPVIEPLRHGWLEVRVPNEVERLGIVELWDSRSGKKLKDLRVYRVRFNPFLERDVQWVFFRDAQLDWPHLRTIDEKGRRKSINLEKALGRKLSSTLNFTTHGNG
jgi:hypothetical protein